jgi:hypothetical protein
MMISDIVCFKLITGEEVIGMKVSDNPYALQDAAAIMTIPNQQTGQLNIGLVPFLPYSDDKTFNFTKESIIIRFTPNTDLINNYNRIFGAGIQIASKIQ